MKVKVCNYLTITFAVGEDDKMFKGTTEEDEESVCVCEDERIMKQGAGRNVGRGEKA